MARRELSARPHREAPGRPGGFARQGRRRGHPRRGRGLVRRVPRLPPTQPIISQPPRSTTPHAPRRRRCRYSEP